MRSDRNILRNKQANKWNVESRHRRRELLMNIKHYVGISTSRLMT